jgi:hypothetical protein
MNSRIEILKLADVLGGSPYRLLLGLGFDQRSTELLKKLSNANGLVDVLAVTNVGWNESNKPATTFFTNHTNGKGRIVGKDCTNVLQLADDLASIIRTFDGSIRTIIDITSMSHELLAILIALLNNQGKLTGITLCYTGAKQYSFNTTEAEIWLSKGVNAIRSVLGFPGEQLPSRPLHLVIPMGFEVERAFEVISAYEPAALSLGMGRREASISDAHFESNSRFFKRLEDFVKDQEIECETLSTFSFSCIDPIDTKNDIAKHLVNYTDFNTVICPLNTKISTVGVALLCIERPEIQLCYAQPIEYNVEGYAIPDEWITVVHL